MSTERSNHGMSRRDLLRGTLALGSLAATSGALAACTQAASTPPAATAQPQVVEVTKVVEKPVEKVVEKIITPTAAAESVTLTYWDSNPDPVREQGVKDAFARFATIHPNVKGIYVPTSANTYLQKLTTAIGGGKPPDAVDMQGGWLAQFASMGALLDLEPFLSTWKYKDDYLSSYMKLSKAYGNKMYWLPTGMFWLAILYRPDYIKEAGIKSPADYYKEGKWTWDAFVEVAKGLNQPGKNRYGFSLRGGLGAERNLFNVIMSYNGGKWFQDDGTCLLGKDEAISAVTWYADLLKKEKVTPSSAPNDGWREMSGNFTSGVVGMYMHSADGLGDQRTALGFDKVAAVPLPAGPAGSWQQLDGLGASALAQTKNAALAAEFVFSRLTPDTFDATIKKDLDAGKKPYTSVTDMVFKSVFERKEYKDDPYVWAFNEVGLKGEKVYINPVHLPEYTSLVNGMVIPEFQKILLGQMAVKDACTHWAAEFTKAQKAFIERQKIG